MTRSELFYIEVNDIKYSHSSIAQHLTDPSNLTKRTLADASSVRNRASSTPWPPPNIPRPKTGKIYFILSKRESEQVDLGNVYSSINDDDVSFTSPDYSKRQGYSSIQSPQKSSNTDSDADYGYERYDKSKLKDEQNKTSRTRTTSCNGYDNAVKDNGKANGYDKMGKVNPDVAKRKRKFSRDSSSIKETSKKSWYHKIGTVITGGGSLKLGASESEKTNKGKTKTIGYDKTDKMDNKQEDATENKNTRITSIEGEKEIRNGKAKARTGSDKKRKISTIDKPILDNLLEHGTGNSIDKTPFVESTDACVEQNTTVDIETPEAPRTSDSTQYDQDKDFSSTIHFEDTVIGTYVRRNSDVVEQVNETLANTSADGSFDHSGLTTEGTEHREDLSNTIHIEETVVGTYVKRNSNVVEEALDTLAYTSVDGKVDHSGNIKQETGHNKTLESISRIIEVTDVAAKTSEVTVSEIKDTALTIDDISNEDQPNQSDINN